MVVASDASVPARDGWILHRASELQLIDGDVKATDASELDHTLADRDRPGADKVAAHGKRLRPVDSDGQYHRVDFELDAMFVSTSLAAAASFLLQAQREQ